MLVLRVFLLILIIYFLPLHTQAQIAKKKIVGNLAQPVDIADAGDGSGRLFVVLQSGKIVIFDGTKILSKPFLNISSSVSCCSERGLLSLAFHPKYKTNGYFYIHYTNPVGDLVVARYQVSGNPNVADP